jgi:RNA polymerase sigma factor (sigma-70 family)
VAGPVRIGGGARQELDRLRGIVAALPLQCRRVFELRKFQGLSHRDIAQRMGLSEKTIENHLTRALARIAEMLAAKRAADIDRGTD